MGIENLKTMKDQIMSCVQGQLSDISRVNSKELGEAIDMIKDLSEAIYYCTIVDSMEKADKEEKQVNNINYYSTAVPETYKYHSTETPLKTATMYYPYMNDNVFHYSSATDTWRDPNEGRSPIRRRMYMEGQKKHNAPSSQMKELETYLQELSSDITEMIRDASQEEKALLRQKMTTLADKIV